MYGVVVEVNRWDWLAVIIQSMMQALLTLALHCAELIFNVRRDEHTWRKASTKSGVAADTSGIKEALTDRRTIALYVFKSVVQWTFGLAVTFNIFITSNLLLLAILMVSLFLLCCFAEFSVRSSLNGHQPITYGDPALIASLMDEAENDPARDRLYGGDKGEIDRI
ncbi:hypothetical protein M501DRAFT_924356 [Patellaria atrata CBS 101060]|uniref:Uncharacterized protein n=1 Tax=Patellaria atrata CBS 101060 TaxID=1346257 RepID=A0A9P4SHQ1_9PEZI|nr:hypothetical protein M501DRAFT_924356 [Patellaria atrata CBS 101060]